MMRAVSEWLCVIPSAGRARLVAADPSVAAGIKTPELDPFRASLPRGRKP
jgi:hypothetical protein